MLIKLDTVLSTNNGLEIIPIYFDENLCVGDQQTPTGYCVNPLVILKREVFLQKYDESLPDNAPYVIVFMTRLSESAQYYCLLELEYLVDTRYDIFSEHLDYFTNYGYDEDTHNIYIGNNDPLDPKILKMLTKIMGENDTTTAMREGVDEAYYRITKLLTEQMEFLRTKYAGLIHPSQMVYSISTIIRELQSRLNYLRSCQYWHIPVIHLVPGIIMDYAVAQALNMKTVLNDMYGFLVQYPEEDMQECYGVLTQKDGSIWSVFNPSTDSDHSDYAIETYLLSKLDNKDPIETTVTPEQLRSWPNWNESFNEETIIERWLSCAGILINESKVDKIQNIKMIKVPSTIIEFNQ